jgi:hypothetical protein
VTRILSAASAAWAGYVPRRTSDRRALAAFVAGVLRVYESARLEDWPAVLATINAAEE